MNPVFSLWRDFLKAAAVLRLLVVVVTVVIGALCAAQTSFAQASPSSSSLPITAAAQDSTAKAEELDQLSLEDLLVVS